MYIRTIANLLAAELKNPTAVTSEQHVDRDRFGSLVVNKSLSNNQTGLVANIRRVPFNVEVLDLQRINKASPALNLITGLEYSTKSKASTSLFHASPVNRGGREIPQHADLHKNSTPT